jgi:hypothetical protein
MTVLAAAPATASAERAAALGTDGTARTVAATPAERTAMLKAFGDRGPAWPCLSVRLAAADRDYGTVRVRARRGCRRWVFNGTNVLRRYRRGRWRVLFEGSAYRCPLPRIPLRVQRELGVCPYPGPSHRKSSARQQSRARVITENRPAAHRRRRLDPRRQQ